MKPVKKIGYMCYTDFLLELGEAPGGIHVYASKEDCVARRKCVDQCGIVKVNITMDKIIKDPNFSNLKVKNVKTKKVK